MKKLYFFLIAFSLIAKTISAQTYYPLIDSANHWHSITNYIPVRQGPPSTTANLPCSYPVWYVSMLDEYTMQDTVINTVSYKMVGAYSDFNPTVCIMGFIREDVNARKVYFMDNMMNPEILLYDFSMTPGNTISINFTTGGYFTSGTFTLDSIRNVHISTGFRKIFYLSNHAVPFSPVLPWIESVGSPINAFYPYSMNSGSGNQFSSCYDFSHDATEFVTCFDHATRVYYDSCAYNEALLNSCFDTQDTCNYHNVCGSVNEISSISSFGIFPNPAQEKTMISIDVAHKDEFEIIVWDISGKKIMKEIPLGTIPEGRKDVEIDLSALQNGFYLVECRGENGAAYRKLLIQR